MSPGGVVVGKITVGGVTVPVKRVRMAADGSLDSVASHRVAAVVSDYQPLHARIGTTVLLWHSRYGAGCPGTLNVLLGKSVGSTFSVTDEHGTKRRYRIAAVNTVVKGQYWSEWFRFDGPRQLTLVTCTGLVNNVFTDNVVITAVPA